MNNPARPTRLTAAVMIACLGLVAAIGAAQPSQDGACCPCVFNPLEK